MNVLRTAGITKDYPGCRALDDVTVSFDSGRVHALIGKNGSGKSTLVKVFAGAITPTDGEFYLDDAKLNFEAPTDALNKGIATVYQELSLIPVLERGRKHFPGSPAQKRQDRRLEDRQRKRRASCSRK